MKIQISNFAGICPKSLPPVLSKAKLWSHFDQPIPFCQGAWMLQFANTWHQTCYILCAGDPGDPWCILDCDDLWWRKKLSEVPNQRHFIASIFNFSSACPFAGGFTDVLWWTLLDAWSVQITFNWGPSQEMNQAMIFQQRDGTSWNQRNNYSFRNCGVIMFNLSSRHWVFQHVQVEAWAMILFLVRAHISWQSSTNIASGWEIHEWTVWTSQFLTNQLPVLIALFIKMTFLVARGTYHISKPALPLTPRLGCEPHAVFPPFAGHGFYLFERRQNLEPRQQWFTQKNSAIPSSIVINAGLPVSSKLEDQQNQQSMTCFHQWKPLVEALF